MKYLRECKHCKKQFKTNKEDKFFCCSNHKAIYNRRQNPKPKNKFICEKCGKEFESYKKNLRTCSRKCISDLQNDKLRERKRIENEEKFKDIVDIPTCKICGWKARSLQPHLTTHNLTIAQYRQEYKVNDDEIFHSTFTEEKRERIKGEKNPAYNHGGKFSPFSENFIRYEGLTNEEKKNVISETVNKLHKTQKQNGNYNTTIEYYLNKGFTEKEAIEALLKRQSTFSLDICTEKFGKEEGRKIWKARQEKWLDTLDKLPSAEKKRIYEAKMAPLKNTYSMIANELFNSLNIQGAYYGVDERSVKTKNGKFKPDYLLEHKIIEFYGDFWHANPIKYSTEIKLNFPKRAGSIPRTVESIWKKDAFKIKEFNESGYETLIVWEDDYRKNKEGIVKKCLEFLKS